MVKLPDHRIKIIGKRKFRVLKPKRLRTRAPEPEPVQEDTRSWAYKRHLWELGLFGSAAGRPARKWWRGH